MSGGDLMMTVSACPSLLTTSSDHALGLPRANHRKRAGLGPIASGPQIVLQVLTMTTGKIWTPPSTDLCLPPSDQGLHLPETPKLEMNRAAQPETPACSLPGLTSAVKQGSVGYPLFWNGWTLQSSLRVLILYPGLSIKYNVGNYPSLPSLTICSSATPTKNVFRFQASCCVEE